MFKPDGHILAQSDDAVTIMGTTGAVTFQANLRDSLSYLGFDDVPPWLPELVPPVPPMCPVPVVARPMPDPLCMVAPEGADVAGM